MNDPLPQTDTQAYAARSLFQIAFLKDLRFTTQDTDVAVIMNTHLKANLAFRRSFDLCCHLPQASQSQFHHWNCPESLHPSCFVLVNLLWEQNMEFSRFTCSFQGHLGSQAAQLLLEINTVW